MQRQIKKFDAEYSSAVCVVSARDVLVCLSHCVTVLASALGLGLGLGPRLRISHHHHLDFTYNVSCNMCAVDATHTLTTSTSISMATSNPHPQYSASKGPRNRTTLDPFCSQPLSSVCLCDNTPSPSFLCVFTDVARPCSRADFLDNEACIAYQGRGVERQTRYSVHGHVTSHRLSNVSIFTLFIHILSLRVRHVDKDMTRVATWVLNVVGIGTLSVAWLLVGQGRGG